MKVGTSEYWDTTIEMVKAQPSQSSILSKNALQE
jgi:hypothetical protein